MACDNAANLVTMSGRADHIYRMIDHLRSKDKFARLIQSGGKAFHSELVTDIAVSYFTDQLTKLIPG